MVSTDVLLGLDAVPVGSQMTNTTTETKPSATATASPSDRAAALADLEARYEEFCPSGTIATHHTKVVFGDGDPNAKLLFIGEAPGAEEDRTGKPFVGRAGKKLNEIIDAMGLSREQVYITNIVKIRPPENRTPTKAEAEASFNYLAAQIAIIQPAVIVTLGGPSVKIILDTKEGITRLRGTWAEYHDVARGLTIPVMPTFHPAYLLRAYTPENRKLVWSDMQQVMQKLGI